MRNKGIRTVLAAAALALVAGGCVVARSTHEQKVREADALRDALGGANRENGILEARNEALRKQVADEKANAEALAARIASLESELRKSDEELSSARVRYEGTRVTREQLITELLEKEKATGKRIQDLGAKVQALEAEGERLRKEAARAAAETSGLRETLASVPDAEALVRERDMLRGRVERLTEERVREVRRRSEWYADLAEAAAALAPGVSAAPLGPVLRLFVPDKVLARNPGKPDLSEAGTAIVALVRQAAAEFPGSSVIVAHPGTGAAESVRAALTGEGGVAPDRVHVIPAGRDRGALLLLMIP